ncbi:MAG: sugar-binding protein [Pirellulales bacterium]|nr:sugar-binding protein [Pirellulales bacterium]
MRSAVIEATDRMALSLVWRLGILVSRRLALALLLLLALGGCENTRTTPDAAKPRFAFVVNVPTDRFWDIAYAGCLKAAQEEDVIVEFHAPNESTAQQQKQIVEALLSRGIDGIAISPLNPDSLSLVLDQAAEQCPVICQDSDAVNSKRACYIGTNNVALGRQMGELLKQALPDGGKLALFVGQLDVANARERQQGVLEALDDPKYEVLGTFTDGAQPAEAKRVVTDVLAKHPDLRGIVGLWGYNAPQAVNALQGSVGREVVVVGSDESIETCRAIRAGHEFGSAAQRPYEFGYQSIKMLAKLYRGEPADVPANKTIFVDTYVITRQNVDQVERDINDKLSELEQLRQFGG